MDHLLLHLRVVSAFVIREIATRYGRSPGGYIWAFLEPVAYVAMMSVLFGAFARLPPEGETFPLFFATGFIAYNMYNGMSGYLSSAISTNKNLLQYPSVSPIDPIVGRAVLQALTSIVVGMVILWAARLLEKHPHSVAWAPLLESTVCAWMLAAGIALANTVLFERFPLYEKIFGIVTRPLLMLSGVFFLPGQMPHPFREILLANPITQVVILFRQGIYGASVLDGLDLAYLFWFSLIFLFSGLFVFTVWPVARRHTR
ncbi:ABC transporter permease [Rhizobium sp. YS-1r]|uniref:ABC transporter permease n=1 Tax=Rhizobium sp. YS-1r TaxID=1532558 RepID=UPI00050F244A|nr:ABC transporter permease [Rhizobium sp. YS-1r]KGE01630.1 hypothetical protein JL39_04485 [Rhizobium sp. YS-1r]